MKRLQEKDLEKLSKISGVPISDLQKLHALRVFHESNVIDRLIKHDFRRIRRNSKYTVTQVIGALALSYQVSEDKVRNAIYEKKQREFICTKCGKVVKKTELVRNNGICDSCVIDNIKRVEL